MMANNCNGINKLFNDIPLFSIYNKHPLIKHFGNCISEKEKNKLNNEWKELRSLYNRIKNFRENIPTIAVVGAFSSGKSTLINALVSDEQSSRKNILPEDLDECTAIPTRLRWGAKEKLLLEKQDPHSGNVTLYDAGEIGLKNFKEIRKGNVNNPLVKAYLSEFNVAILETPDIPEDLKNMEFLDTPGILGIGDDKGVDKEIMNLAALSDVIIFVCDIRQQITEPIIDFLRNIKEKTSAPLIIVANKIDQLDTDEERQIALEKLEEILEDNLGDSISLIVPTSAVYGELGNLKAELLRIVSQISNNKFDSAIKEIVQKTNDIVRELYNKAVASAEDAIKTNEAGLQSFFDENNFRIFIKDLMKDMTPEKIEEVLQSNINETILRLKKRLDQAGIPSTVAESIRLEMQKLIPLLTKNTSFEGIFEKARSIISTAVRFGVQSWLSQLFPITSSDSELICSITDAFSREGEVILPPYELVERRCYLETNARSVIGYNEKSAIVFEIIEFSPRTENSKLEIKNLKFTGNELIIQPGFKIVRFINCSFFGTTIFSDSDLEFRKCNIAGDVAVSKAEVLLENVYLHESRGLYCNSSKVTVKNSMISNGSFGIFSKNSTVTITNSTIENYKYNGLIAEENSKITLDNVNVNGNGKWKERGQIFVEYSELLIKNGTMIYDGHVGIFSKNSTVTITNSTIEDHKYNGLIATENSHVSLIGVKIVRNSNSVDNIYPQIYIDSCTASIENTEIRNGDEGISSKNSTVTIINSAIEHHKYSGLVVGEISEITLDKVSLNGNGKGKENGQIFVEYSELLIKNGTMIYDGDIGIFSKNSTVTITNSTIEDHKYNGLVAGENSKITLDKVSLNGNGKGKESSQIFVEYSELLIKNGTMIYDGDIGIFSKNSTVTITNSTIEDHKYNGLVAEKNSYVTLSGVKIIRNSNGINGIYPQIYILNSCTATIENTEIRNGEAGIYAEDNVKKFYIKGVKISGHKEYGLNYHKASNVTLEENCEINDKIEKRGGGCFITTATIEALGKGDNCDELKLFRKFRDIWLIKEPGGKQLIEEYYRIAPIIVSGINRKKERKKIYKEIWDRYLIRCVEAILSGEYNKAKAIYVKMVEELKEKYYDSHLNNHYKR